MKLLHRDLSVLLAADSALWPRVSVVAFFTVV